MRTRLELLEQARGLGVKLARLEEDRAVELGDGELQRLERRRHLRHQHDARHVLRRHRLRSALREDDGGRDGLVGERRRRGELEAFAVGPRLQQADRRHLQEVCDLPAGPVCRTGAYSERRAGTVQDVLDTLLHGRLWTRARCKGEGEDEGAPSPGACKACQDVPTCCRQRRSRRAVFARGGKARNIRVPSLAFLRFKARNQEDELANPKANPKPHSYCNPTLTPDRQYTAHLAHRQCTLGASCVLTVTI